MKSKNQPRSRNAVPPPKAGSAKAKTKKIKKKLSPQRVREYVGSIFGPTEHARRVESLANAVVGITHVAVLGIHAIGQAYAQVRGISGKSGVKQIDRLLSNGNLVLDSTLKAWVAFVVGGRREVVIALGWTGVDADRQDPLAA